MKNSIKLASVIITLLSITIVGCAKNKPTHKPRVPLLQGETANVCFIDSERNEHAVDNYMKRKQ